MRILATMALALTAAATPALAQEAAPFTGPRAEVVGGWDHVSAGGESESGFTYGGAIGYDLQRGNAVFGIEGEITGATTDRDFTGGSIEAGRDLYAGVRAGVIAAPNTLLYVKGGYANGRITAEAGGDDVSTDLDGFRVGAGVERSFGRFYGKAEYRYTNYSQDVSRHQVLAGLGVRF
jgi:outer membrane immunogenic protein